MALFSNCSSKCCICASGGVGGICLAGNRDDDYYPATTDQVVERLDKGEYLDDREFMIDYLKEHGIVYKENLNEKEPKKI